MTQGKVGQTPTPWQQPSVEGAAWCKPRDPRFLHPRCPAFPEDHQGREPPKAAPGLMRSELVPSLKQRHAAHSSCFYQPGSEKDYLTARVENTDGYLQSVS